MRTTENEFGAVVYCDECERATSLAIRFSERVTVCRECLQNAVVMIDVKAERKAISNAT